METIYNLQRRASELRSKTEIDSISPEEVGGLHADTLAYIAEMEQSADGLGIRKVYQTKAQMEADTTPMGTNGKTLRYGQLVSIYNEADKTSAENGDIYAWQKPGWLKMGNIGNIYELKAKIEDEAAARAAADTALQQKVAAEETARKTADEELRALAEGVVGSIDVTQIDTMPGSVAEAVRMAKDMLHSRRTLTYDGKNVGVVDVFSDSMLHQLTEVLTTHYGMNTEGKLDFSGHMDTTIYRYFRSYNINSAHLKNEKGTWTEWTEYIPETVQKVVSALSGSISKEEKARTEADATLTETIADNTKAIADEATARTAADEELRTAIEEKSGGNTYNVTEKKPLKDGEYYTLATAIKAVETKERKKGRCVSYETAPGKWETKQFKGTTTDSWEETVSWEDFGGAGTIKSVTVNGTPLTPDEQGNVSIDIKETDVDESLSDESTNPVENRVVAAKIKALEAHTLHTLEVVPDGDDNYLYAYDEKGNAISHAKLPAGGGGGTSTTSRILVTAKVSADLIKEGGNTVLTWTYDHVNAENESDGVKATVTISVKLGTTTLWEQETRNVAKGSYEVDLTQYMKTAGDVDVYVNAVCTTDEGERQTKQAYASVKVVGMALTSDYDVSTALQRGGYADGETISIPFTLTGSGLRTVSLYVDGGEVPLTKTVQKSGTTRDAFSIAAGSLTPGRHSLQMIAERDGLRSDVIWIDVLKKGAAEPYVGIMFSDTKGEVVTGDMPIVPTLTARQYDELKFSFAAYDPKAVPATVKETQTADGTVTEKTYAVGRSSQAYSNRYMKQGTVAVKLACGEAVTTFNVDVESSGLDIGEATQGMEMKLTASGRSNTESAEMRQVWENNGYGTTFEGVDWATSGWDGSALVLKNGARATVDYRPFLKDVKASGCTVEVELMVKNVSDRDSVVMDCMENDVKGIRVTAQSATLQSGSTIDREDEENTDPDTGKPIVTKVPVGVESKYSEGERIKMAFTVGKKSDGGVMELYMNGDRCSAMCYQEDDNFMQTAAKGMTFMSDGADVYIYGIRAYSRPLTATETVDNHIVDQQLAETMAELYESNNVINPETGEIDIDAIIKRGRAVIKIVRTEDSGGGLDDVNACKNKKQDFHVDELTIYTPWGDVIRFTNIVMRIQGTSSTKYAIKNFRFYWMKCMKEGLKPEMWINGVKQDVNKLPLYKGDPHPCKVNCAKADFSDSSMKTNTGMANLFNDVLRELCPTPPQEKDPTVRTAIYGYPCDIFACTKADEAHPTFYGQYQMNNDKSDWYEVTGMTDKAKHIALEFLDNGKKLCNFQTDADADTQLDEEFATSYEFNYPKDTLWSGADESAGETNATEYQKTAVKTMLAWVKACVPTGADMTCTDLTTWKSEKFKTEIDSRFSKKNLQYWYLLTEYFAMVDQRAKNTIWRTWDGLRWWVTYYDGDTMLGKRNDSLLAYLYNVARDSWDTEKKKWVFEGHDSWLWCLVLANMEDELKAAAEELRKALSNPKVLKKLEEIEANWSLREYNKSGEMKYITPETKGVRVTENGVTTDGNKFYYMYALSGTRKMQLKHFITNRFALLDAKFGVSNYRADSAGFYLARETSDKADVIKITASDEYYFAYGLSGKDYMEGETGRLLRGEQGTLSVTGKRALNDPMLLFGASRMMELDMRGAAGHLLNGLELGNCSALRKLDLSVDDSSEASKTTWWLVTGGCGQLREVSLRGQTNARSNRQDSTALDFGSQTLLEKLDARGTTVKSVTVAKGAPLKELRLPGTLTTLRLEYLPRLTAEGLEMESCENVATFIFDSCPGLNWKEIYTQCPNVRTLRVADVDMDGDGSDLTAMMEAGMQGVDDDGTVVSHAVLKGEYRLTRSMDESVYEKLTAWLGDELRVVQPEYTMIEFDDMVSDDANVSNLDNGTGYKYGTPYKPSGHIEAILKQRHRVLAKVTKMPTTTAVKIAGVDTAMNNTDGEVTYYPLDDADSYKYADGTEAKLDSTEGDIMMLEPAKWTKGVNDYLNGKHYSCFSSREEMPKVPEATIVTLEEIQTDGGYRKGQKVMSGKDTILNSYTADASYAVCRVSVSGWKKVRFPTVRGTNLVGSAFVDADGTVVKNVVVPTINCKFESGMYVICDVPEGATDLYFTILNTAEFDMVVLSNSDKIEDMEPEWVHEDAYLCAVVGSSVVGEKLRACVTGGSTTGGMTWTDFHYYSQRRGMQQIDAMMHSWIANLAYAKYGRRDMQAECGAGSHDYNRKTGGTMSHGIEDTIGYEAAKAIKADVTNSVVDGVIHQYAWYRAEGEYGTQTVVQTVNTCCLGYEDIYGNKWDMMDRVDLPNDSANQGKWRIWMPDGTTRMVKGATQGLWITGVAHGKWMDMVPTGTVNGSSTTYYTDRYEVSTAAGRVVYRGYSGAHSSAGVSCANAYSDASNASSNVGSRLAFRGKLVRAASVTAYKAISEVA